MIGDKQSPVLKFLCNGFKRQRKRSVAGADEFLIRHSDAHLVIGLLIHSRSVTSHYRLDDRTLRSSIQGSVRNGSIRTQKSSRSSSYQLTGAEGGARRSGKGASARSAEESHRVHNQVQAQIEKMFTDVAKDATACSFPVRCLGALPLKDKVTSLLGLQDPLRQLYLSGAGHGVSGLV